MNKTPDAERMDCEGNMSADITASWAARLARAFDMSGIHRASTPGDYESGEWLCEEARAGGADVSKMHCDLPHTVVEEAYLECNGHRIDGLPMFDAPATAGIEGRIGLCGSDCEIGYLEMPPNAASIKGMRLEAIRRETRHAALVIATRVTGESLAPINAQFFGAPIGPPVLLVAGMHHDRLSAVASAQDRARLVSRYTQEPAQSYNVFAHVAASTGLRSAAGDTGAPQRPLVLITPRTGWWESTAERAGGLVAWLAGVQAAAALGRDRRLTADVHGFATCGHELGHVGLHTLLKDRTALLRDAAPWLHLGANLGCASNENMMLRASDSADAEHMRELLIAAGYPARAVARGQQRALSCGKRSLAVQRECGPCRSDITRGHRLGARGCIGAIAALRC
jgi:hypothetical protein